MYICILRVKCFDPTVNIPSLWDSRDPGWQLWVSMPLPSAYVSKTINILINCKNFLNTIANIFHSSGNWAIMVLLFGPLKNVPRQTYKVTRSLVKWSEREHSAVYQIVEQAAMAEREASTRSIRVCGLQFAYESQNPLFAEFNLELSPGSRCLLVGANGSGNLLTLARDLRVCSCILWSSWYIYRLLVDVFFLIFVSKLS